jgi:predicted transcriptional regulator of viral defense system
MKPREFFARHPVFTHAEFVRAHAGQGRSEHTSNAALAQGVAAGRLVRVRKGIYAAVPPGVSVEAARPDPYLVATKLRDDAVVGYHSALEFHGRAYSTWSRVQYVTAARVRSFRFRGTEFVGEQAPAAVRDLPDFGGGVNVRPHAGGEVRVTSLERAVVDVLHAPDRGGGWEEVSRSLELIEFLDLNEVLAFTAKLRSALTAARVGFFLERHAEGWMVEEKHLAALAPHVPRQPSYLDARRKSGRLLFRWNLVVPEALLDRQWEELA